MVYLIRRKKDVKRIFFVSIFIISMLLVNIHIFNSLYLDGSNNQLTNLLNDDNKLFSSETDPYLTDYYTTGSGDNQDVRIYALNSSYSNDNNQGSFDIPSMSVADTTYLTYGNFNFTFQNNYTTDHIIEDTNALDASDFIKFTYNTGDSSMDVNTGEVLNPPIDLGKLVDVNNNTYIELNSSSGILNFTIDSSFAGTSYTRVSPTINLAFNRSFILGLISTFSHSIDEDAYLTIKLFDSSDSSWNNVTEAFFINSSLGIQSVEESYINENLRYINSSDITQIQFFLQRFDSIDFVLRLREFKLDATYAFDLPITNSEYVALEFDLKGENSAVNGFYAWIRTLNLTKALTAELNITLYEANTTIARTQANLISNNLKPNNAKLIDSIIIDYIDYHGDSLSYFEFNQANTQNLKLNNYFIVIKSNHPDKIFSLVTLPRQTFGDPDSQVDHQLRTTNNDGLTWNVAKKQVTPGYESEELDATAFKLNVTRGYMPSDFINLEDNQDTLRIQDISIEDQIISDPPYDVSSSLTWGLGQWNNNFTVEIASVSNNLQIDLTWNSSIIQGFKFNVTYTVKGYWVENANSYYKVSYDTTPRWDLNYTLDLSDVNLDNWNFLEFWFVYPNDWDAKNLTNPNYNDIYGEVVNSTGGETNFDANPSYDFVAITSSIVNGIDGTYSLNLTSSNLIDEMHSYINYNGILWETNGFMYGDNISVRVDILGPGDIPPTNGNANVKLFYPDNSTIFPGAEMSSGAGLIKDNSLVYDFNNLTILDVTKDTPLLGNYYLGYFWENGSAVGCKKLKLYIDTYEVNMNSLFYEPILNQNILDGIVDKVYESYSMLIGTINVTDDKYYPDFYAVNNSDINQQFIYEINGEEIPILVKTFLQNETLLNPNEDIKIGATIQNLHDFVDLEVKLKVQLVSLVNEEWIIAEKYTDIKTLKPSVDPNGDDTQEFSVGLTIPTLQSDEVWQGVNAPVRKGGAKTIFTIYFEYDGISHEVDTFESNEYSLVINSTQNEFEGYIITLKYDEEITGASILKPFDRESCQYMPNQTTFVVNIYDKNYVSSYNQFIDSFSLKINSQFSDIVINPQTPIYGQKFNISSVLATEFGDEIPNKNVTCQFFNIGLWENVSSQISSANGVTNFEIDTLSLPREDDLLFRLTWLGEQYVLENSQNISVSLYKVSNNISLGIVSNVNQITRNGKTTIKITLNNIGDSELTVLSSSISIIIEPTLTYSIVEINYLILNNFQPGESTDLIISIDVPAINEMTITISIEATNELTKENITVQALKTFKIYDVPLANYITVFFTVIMIGIFALLWGAMYLYAKRTTKKIETPIEEPSKKKPRRGRYVSVSELPKEETKEMPTKKPSKKSSKKQKQKEIKTEKPTTDLDSLLEEKGLKDEE